MEKLQLSLFNFSIQLNGNLADQCYTFHVGQKASKLFNTNKEAWEEKLAFLSGNSKLHLFCQTFWKDYLVNTTSL